MVSTLKYIEDKMIMFDIDEIFQRKMRRYPQNVIHNIVSQIVDNVDELPKKDYHSQKVYGVIKMPTPMFFSIDYMNENDDVPILIDINEIEVDEYLDAIIENKHLKQDGE
jgi:hypothetical protein